jgi:hypothetical protein
LRRKFSGWNHTGKKLHSGCIDRRARVDPPQFKNPMPHVSILSQMRGRRGLAAGRDHLVNRPPLNELGIKLLTEFAPPTGARVKAFHYLSINMFHETFSWG